MKPKYTLPISLALVKIQEPGLQLRKDAMTMTRDQKEALEDKHFSPETLRPINDLMNQLRNPEHRSLSDKGVLDALDNYLTDSSNNSIRPFITSVRETLLTGEWDVRQKSLESYSYPREDFAGFLLGLAAILRQDGETSIRDGQSATPQPKESNGPFCLRGEGSLVHLSGRVSQHFYPGRLLRDMQIFFPYPKSLVPAEDGFFHLIFQFIPAGESSC
jgi:hypothetical protein